MGAPHHISDITIIIPVKNNQAGIDSFLATLSKLPINHTLLREVIIVDNNSSTPLRQDSYTQLLWPVRYFTCATPGPGAARNVGAQHAKGSWLLFVDSDCVPTPSLFAGYASATPGAVGYQGSIDALGTDVLSRYYVSQDIHKPPRAKGTEAPAYLVTANTLVQRAAFEQVGGFHEAFTLAGGEDIDLAYRLMEHGTLAFAPESVILHDFNDGLSGFIRRFIRYGKGLRLVKHYHPHYRFPRPFTANHKRVMANNLLVILQWLAMYYGYRSMRPNLPKP